MASYMPPGVGDLDVGSNRLGPRQALVLTVSVFTSLDDACTLVDCLSDSFRYFLRDRKELN